MKHEHMKHGGKHVSHKGHKGLKHKKAGGAAKNEHEYNAVGSPEMHEAHEKDDGFKHGGHAKKHGGEAKGKKGHHRLDKMPRRAHGGSVKKHHHAKGGAVMSSASHLSAHEQGGAGNGHEGIQEGD